MNSSNAIRQPPGPATIVAIGTSIVEPSGRAIADSNVPRKSFWSAVFHEANSNELQSRRKPTVKPVASPGLVTYAESRLYQPGDGMLANEVLS